MMVPAAPRVESRTAEETAASAPPMVLSQSISSFVGGVVGHRHRVCQSVRTALTGGWGDDAPGRGRGNAERRRPDGTAPGCEGPQREAAFLAIADLRFAAWFLWMTPLEAALSSFLAASRPAVDGGVLVAGLGGLAELAHGGLAARS